MSATNTTVYSDYTASLARKRVAAGVLFFDDDERVLLVEPTYKVSFEIPGGSVEAGESPYQAAVREVYEELALVTSPGRLLVIDWVPPADRRTEGLMFVYDGGLLTPDQVATMVVPLVELRGYVFATAEEVGRLLSPLLARRVHAAIAARTTGTVAYLEDGHVIV
ncbi:8-oxo-dGTP pyrophosphatase MutT (NUDIX family) [Allocatelliglobosispora scoriae]|uniref:8-oxo-dGTP pyrophosphatase MutT (NUDIX family) n=1 Tax=Allocatelliglobosispora scoriae TaxID=643052 RepID=A0A841C025_9ACTN|nr:NUDIX hydrolase [Allocatelliglobosispora scoriae]MBB5873734.1 8-oxo-dGTP pyrophosphatase MutT (NUDIX family) [Allocatelliglobosispora scoriae]